MKLIALIRYRFFIFVGIFPYLLGQTIAFNLKSAFVWRYFWWGFLGIFLVLVGVELFNEYFDAKEGGDRIFSLEKPNIPEYFFALGLFLFALALFIGLYLSLQIGWTILLFSFLGFLGAYFYVGPPLRWAYRGLGEIVIAVCYGPLMVLGSYYLQAGRVDFIPLLASLICALLIFSLSLSNELPDYIQDKLVGKRNIVVRLGKEKAIKVFSLSLICAFILLGLGVWWKIFPIFCLIGFLMLPLDLKEMALARANLDNPRSFLPVIRMVIITYLVVISSIGIGYLGG